MASGMTRLRIGAAIVILACALSLSLGHVLAGSLGPSSPPKGLSQYGVVRLYATTTFNGHARIILTAGEAAPFFVSGLTLLLDVPASANIILSAISIDGIGNIQLSNSGSTPSSQVVVVTSGLTYGDIVQSMPAYLSFLMMKDPLGNTAIVANGGSNGGIVITITFAGGGLISSAGLTAIATVVAPVDTTVTLDIN